MRILGRKRGGQGCWSALTPSAQSSRGVTSILDGEYGGQECWLALTMCV